jgi:hypothetical protein
MEGRSRTTSVWPLESRLRYELLSSVLLGSLSDRSRGLGRNRRRVPPYAAAWLRKAGARGVDAVIDVH